MSVLRIGAGGKSIWELGEGDYECIEPLVTELEYDVEP